MARGTTRPARAPLPRRLPQPHAYLHNPETGRCASAGCGLPQANAIRHLHDHEPDPRNPGRCARCEQLTGDVRHHDPAELPDVARLAAGERVAA